MLRALALDGLGRRAEARRALELALAAAPDDHAARELLARLEDPPPSPGALRISLEREP